MSYIVTLAPMPPKLDSLALILDKIVQGDCLDLMRRMPDGCMDAVITDPPYSDYVHANVMRGARNRNGAIRGEAKDLAFDPINGVLLQNAGEHLARLSRRWIAVFSDVESAHRVRESLEHGGSEYIRTGAWVKIAPCPQFTGDRPASGFEAITLAHRAGRKRWNGGGSAAVWRFCAHGGDKDIRIHTAQKPLDLMLELARLFSDESETIFDPFLGSGTTAVAAKKLGRHFVGCEINPDYCKIAEKRLLELDAQPELFAPQESPAVQRPLIAPAASGWRE